MAIKCGCERFIRIEPNLIWIQGALGSRKRRRVEMYLVSPDLPLSGFVQLFYVYCDSSVVYWRVIGWWGGCQSHVEYCVDDQSLNRDERDQATYSVRSWHSNRSECD